LRWSATRRTRIDEIALRKGEIESQLEELDSAEKELKKRSAEQ
jgi:chaperonin cofactor prefoldin